MSFNATTISRHDGVLKVCLRYDQIDGCLKWDADGNLISHSITIKTLQPNLAPDLPTDPAEIERIKNQERKRRSCCDPPEGVE